jgi:hypothetical protein
MTTIALTEEETALVDELINRMRLYGKDLNRKQLICEALQALEAHVQDPWAGKPRKGAVWCPRCQQRFAYNGSPACETCMPFSAPAVPS